MTRPCHVVRILRRGFHSSGGPETVHASVLRTTGPRWLHHSTSVFPVPSGGRLPFRFDRTATQSQLRCFSTTISHLAQQKKHWNSSSVGAEPGLDLDSGISESAPGIDHAQVHVIDYSDKRFELVEVPGTLQSFLESQPKPDWASCRWIYVNGISPEVVRNLGHSYGLHPLALEDVMNTESPTTKVDWYEDHFYLEGTLQKLEGAVEETRSHLAEAGARPRPTRRLSYAADNTKDQDLTQELRRPGRHFYSRFEMSVEQVSLFLTAGNTVITVFEHSGADIYEPILARLKSEHTVLRMSNDPSILVQAVIDAIVDLSAPVGKAFGDAFTELELSVLTKPSIEQSRQVYVLRTGLTSFLDLLIPMASLVRSLSDHREVAHRSPPVVANTRPGENSATNTTSPQDFASKAISPLTQAYLKDVQDHITTLTSSTRMAIRSAENLTSLIFNTIAAKQNESVRQLTLVSIFFLPLTFLTGYFGMNFDPMPVVNENSDAFFWWLATPVMGITVSILMLRPGLRRLQAWRQLRSHRRASVDKRTR